MWWPGVSQGGGGGGGLWFRVRGVVGGDGGFLMMLAGSEVLELLLQAGDGLLPQVQFFSHGTEISPRGLSVLLQFLCYCSEFFP